MIRICTKQLYQKRVPKWNYGSLEDYFLGLPMVLGFVPDYWQNIIASDLGEDTEGTNVFVGNRAGKDSSIT